MVEDVAAPVRRHHRVSGLGAAVGAHDGRRVVAHQPVDRRALALVPVVGTDHHDRLSDTVSNSRLTHGSLRPRAPSPSPPTCAAAISAMTTGLRTGARRAPDRPWRCRVPPWRRAPRRWRGRFRPTIWRLRRSGSRRRAAAASRRRARRPWCGRIGAGSASPAVYFGTGS